MGELSVEPVGKTELAKTEQLLAIYRNLFNGFCQRINVRVLPLTSLVLVKRDLQSPKDEYTWPTTHTRAGEMGLGVPKS